MGYWLVCPKKKNSSRNKRKCIQSKFYPKFWVQVSFDHDNCLTEYFFWQKTLLWKFQQWNHCCGLIWKPLTKSTVFSTYLLMHWSWFSIYIMVFFPRCKISLGLLQFIIMRLYWVLSGFMALKRFVCAGKLSIWMN